MTRRGLGAIFMAVGLVVTAIGAFELVSGGGAAGTAAASPTPGLPSRTPSTTGSTTPSPTLAAPTATPTPDANALVRAFVANLAKQIAGATQSTLLDALDPAVIARYGVDACRANLGSFQADPSFAIVVNAVATPTPWDYVTDGKTSTIPDALAVDAIVTGAGASGATPSSGARTLHFHLVDGTVRWFTDCGTPLP